MLPGLKVLSATVVLAVAILTFALGAAALLRATHESFASLPAWKPPAEAMSGFVPVPEPPEEQPTLAVLQVEPEISQTPAVPAPVVVEPVAEPAAEPVEQIITLAPPSPEPASEPEPQVVAALPAAEEPAAEEPAAGEEGRSTWVVAIVPRPEPRLGPLLMPDVATNDALPLNYASLDPAAIVPDVEPLVPAPLPRSRPETEATPVEAPERPRPAQQRFATLPSTIAVPDTIAALQFLQPFFNSHAP